jgi:hypothetical protein
MALKANFARPPTAAPIIRRLFMAMSGVFEFRFGMYFTARCVGVFGDEWKAFCMS